MNDAPSVELNRALDHAAQALERVTALVQAQQPIADHTTGALAQRCVISATAILLKTPSPDPAIAPGTLGALIATAEPTLERAA